MIRGAWANWSSRHRILLAAILLYCGFLRLWRCEESLPGLQIDEAYNAWNAYCVLRTGQDEWGQRFPVFSTRGFNDYRSPLYLYLLLPFQAVGGINVCTTRLPAAIGGIATVAMVYWLGRRMFDDPKVGLCAAAMLAIAPWHIQHNRWGHEATITPLLAATAFIALIRSGAPVVDRPERSRAWVALVCGMLIGVACYGYAAVRIFIPVNLILIGLATAPQWWRFIRTRAGIIAFSGLLAGVVAILGPLAWRQLTDPNMGARAAETHVWSIDDSMAAAAAKVLVRWPAHFSPRSLFMQLPSFLTIMSPEGYGWFQWYMLPALAAGIITIVASSVRSLSARTLLVMFLAFPVGDLAFSDSNLIHPLRSFPGIVALCLVAGVGIVAAIRWVSRTWALATKPAVCGFATWVVLSHLLFVAYFFGPFNDDRERLLLRHVDLMQACEWLRPRLAQSDAVFITQERMFIPHDNILVGLQYDPRSWFAGQREYATGRFPYFNRDVCTKFGNVRIMYGTREAEAELATIEANGRPDHIVMVLRPEQLAMARGRRPALVIGPPGGAWLLCYEFDL